MKAQPVTQDEYLSALAELDAASDAEGDSAPDLAERWRVDVKTARQKLARLLKAGRVEVVGYRRTHGGFGRQKVFRMTTGKAKGK